MPKEFIPSAFADDLPGLGVRVGWSREHGDVQIASIADDDLVLSHPGPEGNGWFVTLDRRAINDLIRVLRRARDGAYGADA